MQYLKSAMTVWFGFVPFTWLWPHREVTVCDTTLFLGPLRVGWINYD